jgi:Tol biopolymer transport system component
MRWLALSLVLSLALASCAHQVSRGAGFFGEAEMFAPGIVSTEYSDLRLTLSPDGRTALWFSRDRPHGHGGAGGYDIWMSRLVANRWSAAEPVSFNSPARDFDPAFTADGKFVYFSSDRPGGLGGDDLWRVRVLASGFGTPEHLGTAVNTAGNEWAPMLSPDGETLLFSSDGLGGAGRMDLFTSRLADDRFAAAAALRGGINTSQDEFDATFLADGSTVVFSRARDIATDDVRLFQSWPATSRYGYGSELPELVNTAGSDTYAPMLDWSRRDRLTFTTRRPASSTRGVDVFVVRYRP